MRNIRQRELKPRASSRVAKSSRKVITRCSADSVPTASIQLQSRRISPASAAVSHCWKSGWLSRNCATGNSHTSPTSREIALQAWRGMSSASIPSRSPRRRKPVIFSRPSGLITQVLKQPAPMRNSDDRRSPARNTYCLARMRRRRNARPSRRLSKCASPGAVHPRGIGERPSQPTGGRDSAASTCDCNMAAAPEADGLGTCIVIAATRATMCGV